MTDIRQHQAFFVSRGLYLGGTGLSDRIHVSPLATGREADPETRGDIMEARGLDAILVDSGDCVK